MSWYHLGADQGYASAQNNLGLMYAEGQGVAQNYVLAYMWLNLAAARFPPSETSTETSPSRTATALPRK